MNDDNVSDNIIDRHVEIERLAALDAVDYECARAGAAESLGMRSPVLDKVVAAKRRELGLTNHVVDDGQGRAVVFADPLPWHEPVDGDLLATALTCTVKTYAVVREEEADAIAFWILHTWLVNSFMHSPRLAVTSPTKGCGKTVILRLCSKLARRSKLVGSISPPALFRAVEAFQPTLLLDENEKYLAPGGDLHAMLNDGHVRGGVAWRVLGDKQELREFAVFCSIAYARNGRIPDDLEQRSIIIVMQRRKWSEALTELRDDRCGHLDVLAKKIARWTGDNVEALKGADPDMAELVNRNADNWRPLFAIADIIGSEWPDRIRQAAAAMLQPDADSMATKLLADIKVAFDERSGEWADRMFSETLAKALADMEGRPWAEWRANKSALPKPLTKNQLANLLDSFKVGSQTVRIGSKSLKGYYRHQFDEAWQRYLPPETSQRNNATAAGTSDNSETSQQKPLLRSENSEKSNTDGHCDVVTSQDGGEADARARDEPDPDCNAEVGDLEIPDFVDRRPTRTCAQCNDTGGDLVRRRHKFGNGKGWQMVWLHPECIRFWKQDHAVTETGRAMGVLQ